MKNSINILSTKKLSEGHKQLLEEARFDLIEADFIKTEHADFEMKDINDNLIFTSQNAVYSVLEHKDVEQLKTKKVFCVGLKTKALLTENGFEVMAYVGYASDLAEIITLIYSKESYTFFSGNLRRDVLPGALKAAGIKFNEIKVYDTTLTPQKIAKAVDGILFFSPSAVESYLKENKIKKELCFCIGETTAEALSGVTKNIIQAEHPTIEDTIMDCIAEFQ